MTLANDLRRIAGATRYRLVNARLVTPDRVLQKGWIGVSGGQISAVRPGTPADDGVFSADLDAAWVLPGFIDLHCHGGAGASFNTADPEEVKAAATFHRRHGTTRMLASVVTSSLDDLTASLAAIGTVARQRAGAWGQVLGAHLEGPFISPQRPGCHDTTLLRRPDTATAEMLLDASPGTVRTMTIAPEMDGGIELAELLQRRGVVAGLGHSAAGYDEALAAFDHGVRLVTHIHNAMRPLLHREPGAVGAFSADKRVVAELIADGIHVHPEVVRLTFGAARDRIALVTDAAPASGLADGSLSHIGHVPVVAWQGRVTLLDRTTLAGSALTMNQAVRNTIRAGVRVLDASRAASTIPARVLGLAHETGALRAGLHADLVVLDHDFDVLAVISRGKPHVGEPSVGSLR